MIFDDLCPEHVGQVLISRINCIKRTLDLCLVESALPVFPMYVICNSNKELSKQHQFAYISAGIWSFFLDNNCRSVLAGLTEVFIPLVVNTLFTFSVTA